jgi:hypothetical protein
MSRKSASEFEKFRRFYKLRQMSKNVVSTGWNIIRLEESVFEVVTYLR